MFDELASDVETARDKRVLNTKRAGEPLIWWRTGMHKILESGTWWAQDRLNMLVWRYRRRCDMSTSLRPTLVQTMCNEGHGQKGGGSDNGE
jgi:hypothetical protein